MFIFIDITELTKIVKRLVGICPKCHQQRELVLLKTYQCFRIFFIPVWRWGEKYFVKDETCSVSYSISEEDAVLVQYGKKELSHCQLKELHEIGAKCTICGRIYDESYRFCPHCGQQRREKV